MEAVSMITSSKLVNFLSRVIQPVLRNITRLTGLVAQVRQCNCESVFYRIPCRLDNTCKYVKCALFCKTKRWNKHKLSTTTKFHYSRVWFLFHQVKSHTNSRGAAGANECCQGLECREREWYAVHNVWGFLLRYFHKLIHIRIYSSRGAFSHWHDWCKSRCNCT